MVGGMVVAVEEEMVMQQRKRKQQHAAKGAPARGQTDEGGGGTGGMATARNVAQTAAAAAGSTTATPPTVGGGPDVSSSRSSSSVNNTVEAAGGAAANLTIAIDEEEGEEDSDGVEEGKESSSSSGGGTDGGGGGGMTEQSTSKQIPLSLLLPMVREEFREPLEQLNRAVNRNGNGGDKKGAKQQQRHQENNTANVIDSDDEDPVGAMQKLIDCVFDADEMDSEQTDNIALCLLRIFDGYLQQKKSYLSDASDENLEETMDQPLYRFFKILCQSAEHSDSRKNLLEIATKMDEECARIGFLFLFYLSSIDNNDGLLTRSNRGNGPSVEQVVTAYKDICHSAGMDWEKSLAKDLEQCSFDDRELFGYLLINVLPKITPYGPPSKVLRLICGSITPTLLSRLMSEIIRENIVLFSEDNVLQLLVESLKWDSLEQMMLWQLLQTEAVQFDKFMDILQRLSYTHHPEATAGVIIIMRNMEPNPELSVMKSLLRNLFLRSPNRDLFTVDAIKLLIDYDENVSPVADCIAKMIKKTLHAGDITGPGKSGTSGTVVKGKSRILTLESILGHLDCIRQHCLEKESRRAEDLLKNPLILDAILAVRKNPRGEQVRSNFDELFALFDILLDVGGRHSALGGHGGARNKHRRKAMGKSSADLDVRSFVI